MKVSWIIFLCFCSAHIFSQTLHPKSQALLDTTSMVLCRCFNTAFDYLDSDVKLLIQEALLNPAVGQQKIQDYLHQAGTERVDQITQQLQKLGSLDSDLTLCFDSGTSIFQHFPCGLEELSIDDQLIVMKDFENEEKTIDLLMQSLYARRACEFAYQFILLGLELKKE